MVPWGPNYYAYIAFSFSVRLWIVHGFSLVYLGSDLFRFQIVWVLREAATSKHMHCGSDIHCWGNKYLSNLAAYKTVIISHCSCGSGWEGLLWTVLAQGPLTPFSQMGAPSRQSSYKKAKLLPPSPAALLPSRLSPHVLIQAFPHWGASTHTTALRWKLCPLWLACLRSRAGTLLPHSFLLTSLLEVPPGSRREEVDNLSVGNHQGPRRVCGMDTQLMHKPGTECLQRAVQFHFNRTCVPWHTGSSHIGYTANDSLG